MKITWRDDDAGADTVKDRFKKLKTVHALLVKYGVLHTVSLICKDVEKNKPFVKFLQAQVKNGTAEVQVHCWTHYDFTTNVETLKNDLSLCKETIKKLFGTVPDTLFPPWNKSSADVEQIAQSVGLKISTEKMSLSGYLKGHEKEVINFHFWDKETEDLEAALIKYTGQ